METATMTPAGLRRAAELLENIEAQKTELAALISGAAVPAATNGTAHTVITKTGQKRKMTPESIAAIRAGQIKRWKKVKAAAKAAAKAPTVAGALAPVAAPVTPASAPAPVAS